MGELVAQDCRLLPFVQTFVDEDIAAAQYPSPHAVDVGRCIAYDDFASQVFCKTVWVTGSEFLDKMTDADRYVD